MYHSHTHVGAQARAHEWLVVGLIHTGPIAKTTKARTYDESRFTIKGSTFTYLISILLRAVSHDCNDVTIEETPARVRKRLVPGVDCDESCDGA